MIDKTILIEYTDACELVVETEEQLSRLIAGLNDVIHDSVKGSNPEYPYEPITFHISGISDRVTTSDIEKMRRILSERRDAAKNKRIEVEAWLNTIPPRMQRIVRYRFIEGNTWAEVARKVGKYGHADAVRKEFNAFMEKNL